MNLNVNDWCNEEYRGKYEGVKFYINRGLRLRHCQGKVYVYHAHRRLNLMRRPRHQELARECGPQLQDECIKIMRDRFTQGKNIFPVTDYAVTKSYHLSPYTDHVIHAMGPDAGPPGEPSTNDEFQNKEEYLTSTMRRVLRAVEELGCGGKKYSVAFSPIGWEVFENAYTPLRLMVEAVIEHLNNEGRDSHINRVYFVSDDREHRRIFEEILDDHIEPAKICSVM